MSFYDNDCQRMKLRQITRDFHFYCKGHHKAMNYEATKHTYRTLCQSFFKEHGIDEELVNIDTVLRNERDLRKELLTQKT